MDKYDELQLKYNHLFAKEVRDENGKLIQYGFEEIELSYDGWYTIIKTLLWHIDYHIKNHPDIPPFKIEQIKSKTGHLCFYYSGGDEIISRMISLACDIADNSCEFCGSSIDVSKKYNWIRTVCKKCDDSFENKNVAVD